MSQLPEEDWDIEITPKSKLLDLRLKDTWHYRDLLLLGGTYRLPGHAGLIPLSDAAGEVVATGPGVTRFAVCRALQSVRSVRLRCPVPPVNPFSPCPPLAADL